LLGVARHMVLAENDNEAKQAAQRAYRPWRKHLELLWKQHGVPFRLTMFPLEFDELQEAGGAFAGTAGGARAYIERQMEMSGASYFVCDISFWESHTGGGDANRATPRPRSIASLPRSGRCRGFGLNMDAASPLPIRADQWPWDLLEPVVLGTLDYLLRRICRKLVEYTLVG
jgi:hypothetical protein